MDKLTVGELAEKTQTTRRALRLYEQIGILTPEREPNGYRVYTEKHVEQVLFIRALRTIGASLKDLRAFYALKDSGLPDSAKHRQMVEMIDQQIAVLIAKRDEIDSALVQLNGYRDQVLVKLARADDLEQPECEIDPTNVVNKQEDRL